MHDLTTYAALFYNLPFFPQLSICLNLVGSAAIADSDFIF